MKKYLLIGVALFCLIISGVFLFLIFENRKNEKIKTDILEKNLSEKESSDKVYSEKELQEIANQTVAEEESQEDSANKTDDIQSIEESTEVAVPIEGQPAEEVKIYKEEDLKGMMSQTQISN